MHITDLIEQLPEDTKARVENAKNSYNRLIREAIRFESRLSLNSGKGDDINEDNSTRVPIRIDTGYPEDIRGFSIPKQYDFAAIISQIRPALLKLKESSEIVAGFISEHQYVGEMDEFVGGGICHAEKEADKLLRLIDDYDLVREVLNVNNNILGCYRYSNNQQVIVQTPATGSGGRGSPARRSVIAATR